MKEFKHFKINEAFEAIDQTFVLTNWNNFLILSQLNDLKTSEIPFTDAHKTLTNLIQTKQDCAL